MYSKTLWTAMVSFGFSLAVTDRLSASYLSRHSGRPKLLNDIAKMKGYL